MKLFAALLAVIISLHSDQPSPAEPATMVLRNGKIVTVDEKIGRAHV